jgi:hypothetical protein
VDTLFDPQFAGVIHYKRTLESCDFREITTTVTYQFLVKDPLDASVLNMIATSTNQKINDYLRDSTNLREMQAVHELVKMADAVAYPAEYYGTYHLAKCVFGLVVAANRNGPI